MAEELFIIDDHDRYGRFRLISWWDQERLRQSKVMVVGAGALGNEVLKNLALLGIGHIFVIDYDIIEGTNLTRSVLYRAQDEGKPKVQVAAERVRQINPDVKTAWLNGNVITDVGLGVFAEMDVVIGCLDNREARLWINRQCWKVGIPWVDGAIQEINGVCKVFVPPDSSCYECAMTEMDYKLINLKYSCPLLKREDILQGKTPTAPTISSIIGGMQTQEALKLLHKMPVKAGAAMVFNGQANNFYITNYQRRENCLSHERYPKIEGIPLGASATAQELLKQAGSTPQKKAALHLDRELLIAVNCPPCDVRREVYKPLENVSLSEGKCPKCKGVMLTEMIHRIEEGQSWTSRPLRELGVPAYDVVKVQTPDHYRFLRLDGDRQSVIVWN